MAHDIAVIEGPRPPRHRGGVERYGAWLERALAARGRLSASGLPYALKAIYGGPNLRTGDGVSAAWVQATGRARWRWALRVHRERAALRAARRVVAISPMVAAELAEVYGVAARVVLNPVIGPVVERAGGERLVFVGHDFDRKGLNVLIAALERDRDLRLDVVGAGRRLGDLGGRVRYHGDVDAAPWIAGAAALVHPARYEPYGNVVAEAIAATVPVVASARTGAACLLHDDHIWRAEEGAAGLLDRIHGALEAPRAAQPPPSEDAHLAQLDAALFG